jgi:tetratricopeptide (TPR) repeat protein
MSSTDKHNWTFRSRFRKGAFGWPSQTAVKRVNEALNEIKKVARQDPVLAAEGAILFLEIVSPALEHVDSSSGAIGSAVNKAIDELASIITSAPVDDTTRDKWMERLWDAAQKDDIPYIEVLYEYWGDLCVTPERASKWVDRLLPALKLSWRPALKMGDYFTGTAACLSAFLKSGRYVELLEMLDKAPFKSWSQQKFGVRALVTIGRIDDAIKYAEESEGLNYYPVAIAKTCEEILLSAGRSEEAYDLYSIEASQKTTSLATFKAIVKKYPKKKPQEILRDLIKSTPGYEGKWFAAAKSAKLYDLALELANSSPCDPRTLIRACRDQANTQSEFAMEVGLAAIRWMREGYGYEITGIDVFNVYDHTFKAGKNIGKKQMIVETFQKISEDKTNKGSFVGKHLAMKLNLENR